MTLAIVHQSPPGAPNAGGLLSWRTCLRDVTFVEAEPMAAGALAEEDAYALLLEVLCGLRSPMLGETQVMGQFKAFLAAVPAEHAWVKRIGQRLLADAGAVRDAHLRCLGSRSYGSAVRQRIAGLEHVGLIGTGQLAAEVLPFVVKDTRRVDLYGRRDTPPFDLPAGVTYRVLRAAIARRPLASAPAPSASAPSALVVAAPVGSEIVSALAAGYANLQLVIDLRGEPGLAPIDAGAPVVALQDIFNDVEAARARAERQAEAARQAIALRAREFARRDDRRPFGWDDLCA